MKRIALYTVVVLCTVAAAVLLWELRVLLITFALGLAVAAAFQPAIHRLKEAGLPDGVALLLPYAGLLVVMVALAVAIGPLLVEDVTRVTDDLTDLYYRIRTEWPQSDLMVERTIADRLPGIETLAEAQDGEEGPLLLRGVSNMAGTLSGLLGRLGIILVISVYWNASAAQFERFWFSLLPVHVRQPAVSQWRTIESGIGRYLRNEVFQSAVAGLLLWLGYSLLGVGYPALLALWGALALWVPWLGPLLAIGTALLIGMLDSTMTGLLAAAFTFTVYAAVHLLAHSRWLRLTDYSSLLMVVMAIGLGLTTGVVGIILGPLLAVALQISLGHLVGLQRRRQEPAGQAEESWAREQLEASARALEALQAQQQTMPQTVRSQVERLDRLVRESGEVLAERYGWDGQQAPEVN